MSQMANIFYFFWVIQESHMEKLISNSDSTSKKSVEKRQVWVKVIWEKKLRIGQEDKNDKQSFYEVRVRGVIIVEFTIMESFVVWSLWNFRKCFKSFTNVLCFKCFFFWAKNSVFEKDIIEKSLPKLFCYVAAPKIKPLKSQKHFLKWKFPLKQMQQ